MIFLLLPAYKSWEVITPYHNVFRSCFEIVAPTQGEITETSMPCIVLQFHSKNRSLKE